MYFALFSGLKKIYFSPAITSMQKLEVWNTYNLFISVIAVIAVIAIPYDYFPTFFNNFIPFLGNNLTIATLIK